MWCVHPAAVTPMAWGKRAQLLPKGKRHQHHQHQHHHPAGTAPQPRVSHPPGELERHLEQKCVCGVSGASASCHPDKNGVWGSKGVELDDVGAFQTRIFIIVRGGYFTVGSSGFGKYRSVCGWAGAHGFKANPAPLVAEADGAPAAVLNTGQMLLPAQDWCGKLAGVPWSLMVVFRGEILAGNRKLKKQVEYWE